MRIETERLILRPWEDRDREPLAQILGDPEVRRFYAKVLTPEETSAQIDWAIARTRENGFHVQAVEHKGNGALVGLLGLARIPEGLRQAIPSEPEVEIGWQFDKSFWGKGLAPEGARACLAYAWQTLGLAEVVAFTFEGNLPSRRVMEKIGMAYDPRGDFEHPNVPEGHRIRPHVLYRIRNPGA